MSPEFITNKQKIFMDPYQLLPIVQEKRKKGSKIVFGNGCFELLHVGHIRYLFAAKALGDVLIVAVNSDESMKKIKPNRKPINPDWERFEIIAAIEAVDYVIPIVEETPVSLIQLFRPDIHTKGTDYTLDKIPERSVVESYGGRVELVGDPKNHSTTHMLRELRSEESPLSEL
jgi:D-beta-D-heptose 7-phosphate kinase/D-beta-D-heptose 1-phosphate adenosyltransferase